MLPAASWGDMGDPSGFQGDPSGPQGDSGAGGTSSSGGWPCDPWKGFLAYGGGTALCDLGLPHQIIQSAGPSCFCWHRLS